ncbi:DUF2795 domain-containing protein [Microbacterium sp.]|uniref:DUF2795 domain-containing protein n=1 Tax=Microbacterium sp. TaxID=51671 RepID=UPI0028AAAF5F|nr:DUF2795 domain-containing protein [Microbacterium sp.]
MSPSPDLRRFLTEMEFPATKDDLVREAIRDGLDRDDIAAIEQLRGYSYSARWQILTALRLGRPSADALVPA